MTDKASAAGWVVQLTIPGVATVLPEGSAWRPATSAAPTFLFFNVAIGSAAKAVEAARKKARALDDAPMRVVRELSTAEIQTIKLRAGEARPA